jgi:hypothetical protein
MLRQGRNQITNTVVLQYLSTQAIKILQGVRMCRLMRTLMLDAAASRNRKGFNVAN